MRYAEHLRDTIDPFTDEPLGSNALRLRNMWAPRMGVIYDWTKEGRSKVYGSVGRFYESIPMTINDFSFSGDTTYSAYWDFAQCNGTNETWDKDPELMVPHPGNCPGSVSRPGVVTAKVCGTGVGVGDWPMRPTANCWFCSRTALATSVAVIPSCAMRSGRSQMRMA